MAHDNRKAAIEEKFKSVVKCRVRIRDTKIEKEKLECEAEINDLLYKMIASHVFNEDEIKKFKKIVRENLK